MNSQVPDKKSDTNKNSNSSITWQKWLLLPTLINSSMKPKIMQATTIREILTGAKAM